VLEIAINCTPKLPSNIEPVEAVVDGRSTTMSALIDEFVSYIRKVVRAELDAALGSKYKGLSDLPKQIENTYEAFVDGISIIGADGITRRLDSFELSVRTKFRAEVLEPNRKVFGNIGVTYAECDTPELNERSTITITQKPGESFVRTFETTNKSAVKSVKD
jgi:hypothetical protein